MAKVEINIALPEVVGIETLRAALSKLPIIPRLDPASNEVTSFTFSPIQSLARINFDTSRVQIFTAEAAVAYTAFYHWLTKQVDSTIELEISKKLWTTPARNRIGPQAHNGKLLVLPRSLKLENLSAPEKSRNAPPKYFAELAEGICNRALKALNEENANFEKKVATWLFEFIYEGLLNVAQHSTKSKAETDVIAYVAISWIKASTLAATIPETRTPDNDENSVTRTRIDWLRTKSTNDEWVLEVAIADNGIGFRNGLKTLLDKSNPDISEQLAGLSGRARFRALQDAAISWALSPFGTRKDTNYFVHKSIAESWRGLFRVLYHTMRLGGSIAVSSGHGYVGGALFQSGERPRAIDAPINERGFPWTTVTAAICPTNNDHQLTLSKSPSELAKPEEIQVSTILQPHVPSRIAAIDDECLEEYATFIEQALRREWHKSSLNEGLDQKIVVVHPNLPLHVSRSDQAGFTFDEDERRARLIAKLMLRWMTPNALIIHCFLLDSPHQSQKIENLIQSIQLYVESLQSLSTHNDPAPVVGIQGLILPGRAGIKLIFSQSKTKNDVENERLDAEVSYREKLWDRLTTYFPEAPRLSEKPSALSASLVDAANSLFLQALVQRAQGNLANIPHSSWYWRNSSPIASESGMVMTPSGALTSEYLSVLALARVNSSFQAALARSFARWLMSLMRENSRRQVVVPDSPYSSYLLLRRIEFNVREILPKEHNDKLTFIHPSTIHTTIDTEDFVIVFGDFRAKGTTIQSCIINISKQDRQEGEFSSSPREIGDHTANSKPLDRIGVFVAVDSMTAGVIFEGRELPIGRFCHHKVFGEYITDSTQLGTSKQAKKQKMRVFAVNPITTELLPSDKTTELEKYYQVYWEHEKTSLHGRSRERYRMVSEEKSKHISYGLQYFGGRYFSCRWPVSKNFEEVEQRTKWVRQISNWVKEAEISEEFGILICYKRGSDVDSMLSRACSELMRDLSSKGRSRKIWRSAFDTVRVLDRQFLASGLDLVIETAELAHQARTPQDSSPGFSFSTEKLSEKFALVFLDNSSVTGQSLQELLAAISDLDSTYFARIHCVLLAPVVTRLMYTEELVLQNTSLLPNTRSRSPRTDFGIPVWFRAIVQLRIPSFQSVEQVSLYRRLNTLVQRSVAEQEVPLIAVRDSISDVAFTLRSMRKIEGQGHGTAVTCPLLQTRTSTEGRTVGNAVANLRQLIAMRAAGLPCWKNLLESFQSLREHDPESLILVLALEPDILDRDEFIASLKPDIVECCLRVILKSGELVDVLNAVWVAMHSNVRAEAFIDAISKASKHRRAILANTAFLLLYGDTGQSPIRFSIVVSAYLRKYQTSELETLVPVFNAISTESGAVTVITNISDARRIVAEYIISNRYKHGVGIAADWQRTREDLQAYLATSRVSNTTIPNFRRESVQAWMERWLFPTYDALHFMLSRVQVPTNGFLSSQEYRRRVQRVLDRVAAELCTDIETGPASIQRLEIAWKELESLSTALYSDQFCTSFDYVRLEWDTGKSWPSSTPFLDWAIPWVVCEPISAIYAHAKSVLNANCIVDFRVDIDGWKWADRRLVGNLGIEGNQLGGLWGAASSQSSPPGTNLLWGTRSKMFSEITRRWLDDAKTHGVLDSQTGLTICVCSFTANNIRMLSIEVENDISPNRKKKSGRGFSELKNLVSQCGGDVTKLDDGRTYNLSLTLEVDYYEFPYEY